MDRGWYMRFIVVVTITAGAWVALWPSINEWVPAPQQIMDLAKDREDGTPGQLAKISLGLDIRGGLRLVYEVEVDEAIRDRRDLRADQLMVELGKRLGLITDDESPTRDQIKQTRDRVTIKSEDDRHIRVTFVQAGDHAKLDRDLLNSYGDLKENSRDEAKGQVLLEVRTEFLEQIRESAVEQARETIGNRIDELGLKEASVTAQDADIIVEVPGADEAEFQRIREIISKTARLEFKIVDDEASFARDLTDLPQGVTTQSETVSAGPNNPSVASTYLVARGLDARRTLSDYADKLRAEGRIPEDHDLLLGELDRVDDEEAPTGNQPTAWRTYYVHHRSEVTGQEIEDSFVANDPQTNKPYVGVTFTNEGADLFRQLTGRNVRRRMSIVLDDRVESAPVIQTEIGKQCQINLGGYRGYNELLNEARDLVIVLKAGALPVPIRPANEQMIGPTLGEDGIRNGAKGAMIGVGLVLLFMLFYYVMGGAVANVMVSLNLLMLLGAFAFFGATLTLPGIAAIALNIGMAVDANVLINERIREELRNGKSARAAVDQGFARAFWAILDSQFTTFLAGVVLFQYGTGPIKGFAITLMIGICTSLFTGIFCSRVMFDWIARGLKVQRLILG